MNDSGYYIGACADCNAVLNRAHAENNVLGYSGTNSGGHLVISNGEWNDNGEGIDTNSQSNGDLPAPQNGACPSGSGSCTVITGNWIHDNNNRDVPGNGLGLVGAGVVVAGGRNDTIANNRFDNNGAWAVALVPYITGVVNGPSDCTDAGGTWDNPFIDALAGGPACFFNDYGSPRQRVQRQRRLRQPDQRRPRRPQRLQRHRDPPGSARSGQLLLWQQRPGRPDPRPEPADDQRGLRDRGTRRRWPTRCSGRCCATCTSSHPTTRCAPARSTRSRTHPSRSAAAGAGS